MEVKVDVDAGEGVPAHLDAKPFAAHLDDPGAALGVALVVGEGDGDEVVARDVGGEGGAGRRGRRDAADGAVGRGAEGPVPARAGGAEHGGAVEHVELERGCGHLGGAGERGIAVRDVVGAAIAVVVLRVADLCGGEEAAGAGAPGGGRTVLAGLAAVEAAAHVAGRRGAGEAGLGGAEDTGAALVHLAIGVVVGAIADLGAGVARLGLIADPGGGDRDAGLVGDGADLVAVERVAVVAEGVVGHALGAAAGHALLDGAGDAVGRRHIGEVFDNGGDAGRALDVLAVAGLVSDGAKEGGAGAEAGRAGVGGAGVAVAAVAIRGAGGGQAAAGDAGIAGGAVVVRRAGERTLTVHAGEAGAVRCVHAAWNHRRGVGGAGVVGGYGVGTRAAVGSAAARVFDAAAGVASAAARVTWRAAPGVAGGAASSAVGRARVCRSAGRLKRDRREQPEDPAR